MKLYKVIYRHNDNLCNKLFNDFRTAYAFILHCTDGNGCLFVRINDSYQQATTDYINLMLDKCNSYNSYKNDNNRQSYYNEFNQYLISFYN